MKKLLYGTLAALLLVLCFTVSALAETQAVLPLLESDLLTVFKALPSFPS